MKLPLIVIVLMLCFTGVSVADPRWEKPVSKQNIPKKKAVGDSFQVKEPVPVVEESSDDILTKYEEERLKKTLSTLKESPTPLRLPDTILRVMFLPYVDSKNVLRNSYYAFVKVEDGKWVVGEYLTTTTKSAKGRVFSPLQSPLPEQVDKKEAKEDKKSDNNKED